MLRLSRLSIHARLGVLRTPVRFLTIQQLSQGDLVRELRLRVHQSSINAENTQSINAENSINVVPGQAEYDLAHLYRAGFGKVQVDHFRSAEMFRRARDLGFAPASAALAQCHIFGCGARQDKRLALALLSEESQAKPEAAASEEIKPEDTTSDRHDGFFARVVMAMMQVV